ncbi:hypothetical protein [Massilia consociata]|uniref:Uncharacterized protein n=1 Tax=Massilia consociata TaxID=760117 RepID=A0ABV6FCK2_9BURK
MKKVANILPEQQDDPALGTYADVWRCIEGTPCCVIDETGRLLNSAELENDCELR